MEEELVQPIEKKSNFKEIFLPAIIILVIILAGVGTGYLLARRQGGVAISTERRKLIGGAELVQGPKEAGIKDESTFKDTAEGRIEPKDGAEVHEGSHKLIRAGGESQTAYLTSSVVDLNQYVGKCVQIWGETFAAQKVGWLMDVGLVKILDRCPSGLEEE